MHDIRVVRDGADGLRDAMRRRGKWDTLGPQVERAIALEGERRKAIQATEEKKAARNAASQEVARRKKAGESADGAAKRLLKAGFTNVGVLEGGIQAWQAADLPLVRGRG